MDGPSHYIIDSIVYTMDGQSESDGQSELKNEEELMRTDTKSDIAGASSLESSQNASFGA